MLKFIHLAWLNLQRNLKRNVATGIAILLGFMGLVILGGYLNRVENYLRVYSLYVTRSGHLSIFKKDGLEMLPMKPKDFSFSIQEQKSIREILQKETEVENYGAFLSATGLIGNGCRSVPFMAQGIEPLLDQKLRQNPELLEWAPKLSTFPKGKGLWEYPEEKGVTPIAVSLGLGRLLGKPHTFDEIPAVPSALIDCQTSDTKARIAQDTNVQLMSQSYSHMISAIDGEVVAHYSTGMIQTEQSSILLPLPSLQKLLDTDRVGYFSLWLKDENKLSIIQSGLEKSFAAKNLSVEIHPWTEEAISPVYTGTMELLNALIHFISAVLLIIISLSIFNTSTITVIERAQEIGVMRCLGFKQSQITSLILWEYTFLCSISLLLGGLLAWGVMSGINASQIPYNPPGISSGMTLQLRANGTIYFFCAALVCIFTWVSTYWAITSLLTKSKNSANLLQKITR